MFLFVVLCSCVSCCVVAACIGVSGVRRAPCEGRSCVVVAFSLLSVRVLCLSFVSLVHFLRAFITRQDRQCVWLVTVLFMGFSRFLLRWNVVSKIAPHGGCFVCVFVFAPPVLVRLCLMAMELCVGMRGSPPLSLSLPHPPTVYVVRRLIYFALWFCVPIQPPYPQPQNTVNAVLC